MMQRQLVACALALGLTGCNVLPIDVGQGRGALLENPVSAKCVTVTLEEGRIIVPLSTMPFGGAFEMEGTGLSYRSVGPMCLQPGAVSL